ncbi:MAG: hypothetical protein ACYC2H_12525 [Thermoplasmatota archaeon]
METGEPPSKPRLAFGRGRASSTVAGSSRKHVPVEDALSRMAGKIGERRRAATPGAPDDEDDGVTA